jgi:pyruvate dehydrogenase E2 component (dihydrolipoamide acetyltransferase)
LTRRRAAPAPFPTDRIDRLEASVPIEVKMAKLSPTMESGQLVKWMVKVGDKVKEGDTLAEIQTDKAVMPMESFDDGTVAHLDVAEGADIILGQRVLVLAKKGEDLSAVGAEAAKAGGGAARPAKVSPGGETTNTPQPVAVAGAEGAQPEGEEDGEAEAVAVGPGGRIKASPLARKIAGNAGVDLARIPGSGPNGRIVRADVEAFLEGKPALAPAARHAAAAPAAKAPAPAPTPAPAAAPAKPWTPPSFAARSPERIPHTRMRKTIADRMLQAKQAAPEIHVTVDIRMERTMAARERLNAALAADKVKLSVGDFVTKAVAMALRKHPALNASYEADAIVRHGDVNVGIAVALDGGLIVPVLHNADLLGLKDIRLGTQALADAARGNKLTPKQMMGGTFTISNLGMYGVKQFDAILNLPEVGILAVGATEARPVVEGGQLVAGQVMSVTLTADHRAVDGATAAEFLRTLKAMLEEPAAMLL